MPSLSYVNEAGTPVTLNFVALGVLRPAGRTLEDVTRANVDGKAYRDVGIKGVPQTLRGVADFMHGSPDTIAQVVAKVLGAKGRVADVIDDLGVTYPAVIVLDVHPARAERSMIYSVVRATGGLVVPPATATHVLDVEFTVEPGA